MTAHWPVIPFFQHKPIIQYTVDAYSKLILLNNSRKNY